MKFNQLQGFVFDKESGVLGAVASVDFVKQTISILTDDDSIVEAKLANAQFLEQVGFIGKVGIINHDVVVTASGQYYEIELVDDSNVQLHLLNKKLERIDKGDLIARTELSVLEPYVQLVGNINILEVESEIDFNIKVVRITRDGEIQFFYACNNVEKEEVDLIKVVFVGHQLLEEENYERITMTHEEYLAEVEGGYVTETSPQALMNYVAGLTYGKKAEPEESQVAVDEEPEEDCDCEDCRLAREEEEDYCDECGNTIEYCDCEEW